MRKLLKFTVIALITLINGCSMLNNITDIQDDNITDIQDGAPSQTIDTNKIPNATPKATPLSHYGNPPSYVVNGKYYHVLKSANGYNKTGIASWYGTKFHGHLTSTREIYNMFGMTAASTELPLPTYAQVTNLQNGKQIIVKVNDRGPFDKDRILDLSYVAATKLGYVKKGTALVRVTAIDPKQWQLQHVAPTPQQPLLITHKPKLFLQIGAFSKKANAQKLQKNLEAITKNPIRVAKTDQKNKIAYLVQIGPIKNVSENDKLRLILSKYGFKHGMPVVQ